PQAWSASPYPYPQLTRLGHGHPVGVWSPGWGMVSRPCPNRRMIQFILHPFSVGSCGCHFGGNEGAIAAEPQPLAMSHGQSVLEDAVPTRLLVASTGRNCVARGCVPPLRHNRLGCDITVFLRPNDPSLGCYCLLCLSLPVRPGIFSGRAA